MKRIYPIIGSVVLVLSLAACETEQPAEEAPETGVIRAGATPDDPCIATDVSPALIETESVQVLDTEEVLAADGTVITPAVYHSKFSPKIIRDREIIEFEAVCDAEESPEFVATLQRALKARGHLDGDITGKMDSRTKRSVRSYQSSQGLNSDILSLETARDLGLVAYEREDV